MSKTKILNKTITTALILLLTASILSVAINIPAVKADPDPAVQFQTSGDATARWTIAKACNGSYSVKLTANCTAQVSYAVIVLPNLNIRFGNITEFLYYYYIATSESPYRPHMCFYMTNNTHTADVTGPEVATAGSPTYDAWTKVIVNGSSQYFFWYGNATGVGPVQGLPNIYNLSAFLTDPVLMNYTVYKIQIEFGWWSVGAGRVGTAYIDGGVKLTVDSTTTTYNLEPDPITLYPTSGPPGTTVEVMAGASNFTASETVYIYIGGTLVNSTATADGNGALYATFKVPYSSGLTPGSYTVTAVGQTSGNTYTATFTVPSRTITLTPSSGSVGTTVTITGLNFNLSGTINITFAGAQWGSTVTANSTGGFSVSRTVPSATAGTKTVNASDGISYATASFTIPTFGISLSPASGPPNTSLQVNGTGFTVSGLVRIYWVSSEVLMKTLSANATGYFSTSFAVPARTAASYTVKAWDIGTNNNATATFTIPSPSINLNTTTGPPGAPIAAWGSNWNCSGTVSIYFDSTIVGNILNDDVNTTGYLGHTNNMTFTVPYLTNGTYTVNATDSINSDTSLTFTIPDPTLWLNTTGGPVGAKIRINGTNWKVSCTGCIDIDIYNSTYCTDLTTASTDVNGTFTAVFTVPNFTIGTYTINVTDGITNHTATISFNVGCAITISPTSGPANSTITVNGNGFTANKNHTVWWDNTLKKTVNATDGTFTTNFTIPNVAAGTHDVWANDTVTGFQTANVTFTVNTPAISLSPNTGTAGTKVTVTGTNFQIDSTVTIKFDSMIVNNTATTSSSGGFTATFYVPNNYTSGAHTVNATASAYMNSATATFTLTGGTATGTIIDLLRHSTYGLEEIKNEIVQILGNLTAMQTDITTIKSYVIDIEAKLDNSTYGLSALKTLLDAIKAKTDTIILAPSEVKFDFGTETSLWEPEFIQVTPTTAYSSDLGYGWTNTTGLYSRDRGAPDYARRDLVFSSLNKTFKVDLPNGTYTVMVTLGDQSYAHDNITLYAEGSLKATIDWIAAGTFAQEVFHVTVSDGNLELTIKDIGGADANWIINTLIIQRSWK